MWLLVGIPNPFISSDFPIVKYNQFLESRKWPFAKSGYGLTGLQIFIPLNHEITLVFFDKDIYKLGDKKKFYHSITKDESLNDINVLQFLNCIETIFFDEKANENYIKDLHKKALQYKRANMTSSELSYLLNENEKENKEIMESGFKNLMRINKSDCQTQLKIDGLKIHSRGQAHKLNDSFAQLRPHALEFR
jgi:hypothetical protein